MHQLNQVMRVMARSDFRSQVIKAIQPFVSPFYDRMPGLISVVDPPFVATKAPNQPTLTRHFGDFTWRTCLRKGA